MSADEPRPQPYKGRHPAHHTSLHFAPKVLFPTPVWICPRPKHSHNNPRFTSISLLILEFSRAEAAFLLGPVLLHHYPPVSPLRSLPLYAFETNNMAGAAGLLARQLKHIQSDKDIPGISCGLLDNNVFEWEVMLMISDDLKFYGGRSCVLASLSKLTDSSSP